MVMLAGHAFLKSSLVPLCMSPTLRYRCFSADLCVKASAAGTAIAAELLPLHKDQARDSESDKHHCKILLMLGDGPQFAAFVCDPVLS